MTLPYSPSIATFNGNGVATHFPFSFKVWEVSQLVVSVVSPEGVVAHMPFTASLTNTGGTVTFLMNNAPLPTGWRLSVMRDMSFDQEVDLITGTRFDPQVIEDALDEATAERQQLREAVGRAIVVPPGDERPPELLAKEILDARDQALSSAANAAISEANAEAAALEAVQARDTALDIIGTATAEGVAAIHVAGEVQLHNIDIAGNNIQVMGLQTIEAVKQEGENQIVRVRGEAALAVNEVIVEADHQAERLVLEASQHIAQAANEADRSSREADRAESAAGKAVDMTGVGLASKEHWGICRVGEGLSVENGIINAVHTKIVSTPVISFPNAVGVGFAYALTVSASTGAPGAVVTKFVLSVDGAASVELQAVNGKGTDTILIAGVFESTGTIAVVAYDSYGNASLQAVTSYIKKDVQVQAPRVIFPAQGDVDVALKPVIILQPASVTGIQSTPTRTQVQIARDAAFVDSVFDSGQVPYDTSIQATVELPDFTQMYIRARHEVEFYGWSAWRSTQNFTTIAKSILPCTVTSPPQGSTGQSLTPTIVLTPMVSTGIVDSPANTQVQIAQDINHTQIIHDTGLAAPYSTSVVSPTLPINTQIFVRARHRGQVLGWGPWSVVHSFVTLNAFTHAPTITAPAEGVMVDSVRPTFTFSAFANTGPADSPAAMQFQLSQNQDFAVNIVDTGEGGGYVTTYTVPNDLPNKVLLYARVRQRGTLWGWSAWSETRAFITVDSFINTPAITAPAAGSTTNTFRPTVNISAFGWTGVADAAANTRLQVSRDAGFTNMLLDTGDAGAYTTSYTSPTDWPMGIQLWVRARHRGARWGWSAWSPVLTFTILTGYINKPSIIYPSGPLLISDRAAIFGSAFSCVGGDSFKSATLTLRKGSDAPIVRSGSYINFDIMDIPVGTYQATLSYQGNFLPSSGEGPATAIKKVQYRHIMLDTVNKTIVDGITFEEIAPAIVYIGPTGNHIITYMPPNPFDVFGHYFCCSNGNDPSGTKYSAALLSLDFKTKIDFYWPYGDMHLIQYRGKCIMNGIEFNSIDDLISGVKRPVTLPSASYISSKSWAITSDGELIGPYGGSLATTTDFVNFTTIPVPYVGNMISHPTVPNLMFTEKYTNNMQYVTYSFDKFKTYATTMFSINNGISVLHLGYVNGTFVCGGHDRIMSWKWGDAQATYNPVGGWRGNMCVGADGWLYSSFNFTNTGNRFQYAKSADGINWEPIIVGNQPQRYVPWETRYYAKVL